VPDDEKGPAGGDTDRTEEEKSSGILGFFDMMRRSAVETSSG
jgi:hypothetical protein